MNLLHLFALILLSAGFSHQEELKCVSGFCLPRNYEKLESPKPLKTTTIHVEVDVMDVLNVNDKEFSVTLSMYFSVRWEEPRLITNHSRPHVSGEMTPIDLEFLHHLWVPNIFIYDLRSFNTLNVLKKLAGVWISEDKEIYYNQAAAVTFLCPMRFDKYPLDSHICKFRVGSTNFNIKRMRFAETLLTFDPTLRNTILDYSMSMDLLREEDRILEYGALGNYSITGIEINFIRHKLKYLYVYYLPSGLFVVVSWASFLIPPEIVPGRMAMLITLFLVLINIFNIVTTNSPNVEGMTAIAAWMIGCIFFVFGALGGYAYLLWKKKKSCLKRKRFRKMSEEEATNRTKNKEEFRSKVDDMFLVMFPLLFFLFNCFYWPLCLSKSGDTK
ncbi:glutamate-gated chloride channel subunit beta [Lepeophtheirus salmonis]|nr:glutamate-gated chloride channel subunit beta-like [Lepeophtheirus salmonis]